MKLRYVAIAILLVATRMSLQGAVVLPRDLPVGAQYQLVFVTAGVTHATSSDISYYNDFVTAEAARSSELPQNVTWRAVGSTSEVDALDNAPHYDRLPVYDTQGMQVSRYQFYGSGTHHRGILYDQFGEWHDIGTFEVWTGSSDLGTEFQVTGPWDARPLGSTYAACGNNLYPSGWLGGAYGNLSEYRSLPMYALSSPLTVPEPPTYALAAMGVIGLLALKRRMMSEDSRSS